MKRLCPGGWHPGGLLHDPPRVLGDAPGSPEESTHGLCSECQAAMDAYLTQLAAGGKRNADHDCDDRDHLRGRTNPRILA